MKDVINQARRRWLGVIGVSPLLVMFAPWVKASAAGSVDWNSLQDTASVPPAEKVEATMSRLFGTRPIEYTETKLKFTVPNVAENGAVVPSEIELTPVLDKDVYVKQITWIVDKNRRPQTVTFDFTPDTGMGYAATYLRLGQTTNVRAILELSDGKLIGAQREVKVVAGGCGG